MIDQTHPFFDVMTSFITLVITHSVIPDFRVEKNFDSSLTIAELKQKVRTDGYSNFDKISSCKTSNTIFSHLTSNANLYCMACGCDLLDGALVSTFQLDFSDLNDFDLHDMMSS